MNNWQTIAANAHKVPGLWARYKEMTDYFEVFKGDNRIASVSSSDDSVVARSALMLIVDAIEAAGLGLFSRVPHEAKRDTIEHGWIFWKKNSGGIPTVRVTDTDEHIALATVVARVLEQLPEVKA